MSGATLTLLRDLLASRYDELKRKLTWRLGSSDLASDALHDTWVHLEKRREDGAPVTNPGAYLVRIATNLASDRINRDSRYLDHPELDALLDDIADLVPGPAHIAESRSEMDALAAIIEGLPPRRRAIFLAVRVEELSNQEVAQRFGISSRLVGLELKRAHEYCASRMPQRSLHK